MFCLESCWNPSEECSHSGSVGQVQRQAGQGPTHPTASRAPALVLLVLCCGKRHKKQRRNKKQKAEQELSASPTGHGDIVDSDLGTPLAVVGQEGLSEDVTSRLSDQGGCPLGRGPRGGSCCYKALGSIAGPWVSELEEAERRSEATGLCPDFPDPRSFDCVPPGNEKPDLQQECSSELR